MKEHTVECILCNWTGYKKDIIKKVVQDDYVEDGDSMVYEWCPKCKGGHHKEDGTIVDI
tara:strand:- start:348 stop:524 length:177 start_codon:yes stop_codon:yes gene_type:complete